MTESCIIKDRDGRLRCIYTKDGSLYIRELRAMSWSRQQLIGSGIKNSFTVAASDNRDICVLYQQQDGNICFACKKNHWTPKIILERHGSDNPNIIIHSIIKNNRMKLLYNIPHEREQSIAVQYQTEDGMWSRAAEIDSFFPFNNKTFRCIKLKNHSIVLYMRRKPEVQFGYRRITEEKISGYRQVYATGYTISDYSVLEYSNMLHFAFVVSTGFSQQIVYVCDTDCPRPVIVTEGRGIKSCMLSYVDNKIYLWWFFGTSLYYSVSYDNGISFSSPERYVHNLYDRIIKAQCIIEGDNWLYAFNDLYVRENMPWDISLIDDICPDFYCSRFSPDEKTEDRDESQRLKSNIDNMQRRLDVFAAQINERDEKINQLNILLKQKNDELISLEKRRAAKKREELTNASPKSDTPALTVKQENQKCEIVPVEPKP